ncbi:hypothetical protein LZD49_27860 [Dyadobacter sp. CY261]|uniref:hypothetical protein n=1 Tax=Dyadobacter sp. CY261 TaxID=2907203 RepID=UPI001F2F50B7|nr:hypothetical protein [Dyadobacter sp. CY261]MCF0074331.1 hypothetical protein [Dyadobacter sp. CY261]
MRKSIIHTKPYLVLLFTCPVIGLIAWLRRDYAADLQLYDTYYVLNMGLVAEALITVMLIASIIYWLSRTRTGFPQLTAAHVLGTIGITLYLVSAMGTPPQTDAATWAPISPQQYREWDDLSTRFALGLVTLGSIQILLVANLIVKWFKG